MLSVNIFSKEASDGAAGSLRSEVPEMLRVCEVLTTSVVSTSEMVSVPLALRDASVSVSEASSLPNSSDEVGILVQLELFVDHS